MGRMQNIPPLRPSLLVLAASVLLVSLLTACKDKPAAPAARPAPEVGVYVVAAQDAPLRLELPGRLSASQVAEIRPQVGGLVLKRLFTEGTRVAAGQPLYQLDAASFEAERARAAAALQKAQAQLAAARVKAARDAELLRADAISRQAADDSEAALRQAEADVAVAQAALSAAAVQLQRARIVAPISGRIEVSTVTPGALVTANQTQALTTIQQLDPMHVDIVQSSAELLSLRRQLGGCRTWGVEAKFDPSEDSFRRVCSPIADAMGQKAGEKWTAAVKLQPTIPESDSLLSGQSASREVQLVLEDGSVHASPATLQFSGLKVDPGTGSVTLRAVVPNPQGTLLPGMLVQARVLAGVDKDVLLVPQQGVSRTPTGAATALVVGEGNKVERRQLTLARDVGNQWLVSSGLKVGDRVVIEGLQRARAGMVVTPVAAGSGAANKAPNNGAKSGANQAAGGTPASAAPSGTTGAPVAR
jgi:membrane fusion protein, multidrug efflux system